MSTLECSDCISNYKAKLSFMPDSWASALAKLLCDLKGSGTSCDDVKNCESLTKLSPFEISDGQACIEFTDENKVVVRRCFSVDLLLNSSLDNIDPKCIATMTEWSNMTFSQRFQALVN